MPEGKIRRPCGATCRLKYLSESSEQERVDIFKINWSVGDINAQIILSLNDLSDQARLESLWSCFRLGN